MQSYVRLLLSPREVRKDDGTVDFVTRRGSLMGEPGTKVILTLITKCVDTSVRAELPRCFSRETLRKHPF